MARSGSRAAQQAGVGAYPFAAGVSPQEGGLLMASDNKPVADDLLAILRCPVCMQTYTDEAERARRGKLTLVGGAWLACADCGRRYPIVDGIPHMLEAEAQVAPVA